MDGRRGVRARTGSGLQAGSSPPVLRPAMMCSASLVGPRVVRSITRMTSPIVRRAGIGELVQVAPQGIQPKPLNLGEDAPRPRPDLHALRAATLDRRRPPRRACRAGSDGGPVTHRSSESVAATSVTRPTDVVQCGPAGGQSFGLSASGAAPAPATAGDGWPQTPAHARVGSSALRPRARTTPPSCFGRPGAHCCVRHVEGGHCSPPVTVSRTSRLSVRSLHRRFEFVSQSHE